VSLVPILRVCAGGVSVPMPGLLTAWAVVVLTLFTPGCGSGEPQIATDVPQVKAAATPDISGPRPKGMPKTATFKIDPATGRIMGPPS
jgi:hypothetical protein